ncbi:MAG: hypothetical protein QNJ78_11160, partial [Gammaproteobacteria bacterium]|nr:hypothetical protein [Gammaproteobacteria bacterium]
AKYAGKVAVTDLQDVDYALAARMVDSSIIDAFPVDADYLADAAEAETWVWDPSMESLQIVNEILCYVQQTAAKDMVNAGGYIALIDEDKCQEGENQSSASSGGAQSSSSNADTVEYTNWTVVSTRADNDSPQIVKIWVPGDEEEAEQDPMDAQRILVETTITEGVTDENPYGSFVMNFKGEAPIGPEGAYMPIMRGTLKTVEHAQGKPQFMFFNEMGGAIDPDIPFERIEKSNVVMDDADGTSGQARTYMEETDGSFSRQRGFDVAYNSSYFLRGKDTNGDSAVDDLTCTSRADYSTQTWRYNLYHTLDGIYNDQSVSAGQRVSLNSGFPFFYEDVDGRHFGHIGYWGIWTEEELGIDQLAGQVITKETFGDQATAQDFTVQVSGGKLFRRSKISSTYADMAGVQLNWWGDIEDPDCENGCMTQHDYRATVNDNDQLIVTHSLTWGDNGPKLTDIPDVDITPANEWNQRWMWADSLGGSVVFKPADAVVDPVVFFKEEQVSPADPDLPTTLFCYERCLKGGLSENTLPELESDLFHILWNGSESTQEHTYTLSVIDGQFVLTDEMSNEVSVDFMMPAELGDWYQWGINTGEMVTSQLVDWWSVFDQDVTYRWETGPNPWNRTVSVTDSSGESQTFDKPLQFTYTYTAGDDPNGDNFTNGTPFMLEYGGPGELWGFPWEKLDDACQEAEEDCRWVSGLTLKTGVELIGDSNSFIVRAMESEQSMNETVDTTPCLSSGLDVSGINLTLPTAVDGNVSITWSEKPVITDSPAVIEGVVQAE